MKTFGLLIITLVLMTTHVYAVDAFFHDQSLIAARIVHAQHRTNQHVESAHIAFTRGHYDRTNRRPCNPQRVHPAVSQFYVDGWMQADAMLRNNAMREAEREMQWRREHRERNR